jgi:hypothetical protein
MSIIFLLEFNSPTRKMCQEKVEFESIIWRSQMVSPIRETSNPRPTAK